MLTEVIVIEKEHRVVLSTVRVFGAAKELVEGSRQRRRSSGRGQNEFVAERMCCVHKELHNGGLVGLNLGSQRS